MRTSILICSLLFTIEPLCPRVSYPFRETAEDSRILAYWYNIPEASATLKTMGKTFRFHSSLHVYGRRPSESFTVRAQVYLKDGQNIFDQTFRIGRDTQDKSYTIEFNRGFFKLKKRVNYLRQNPDRIVITVKSPKGETSKRIKCTYHRLHGRITDFKGRPFRAFVAIRPDAFSFSTAIWSDSSGHYEVYLPERTYNNLVVDDESYGITTAEAWAWHVILDSDQRLDFKVGTGEVYNLNVWANNGGGNTYFVSFRPMSLHLFKSAKERRITIGGGKYRLSGIVPDLGVDDISVRINGRPVEIVSLQKYYETWGDRAVLAYLVQVSRGNLSRIGKQTVLVELDSELEIDGKRLKNNGIGYFQMYLNYSGLATYF